jgi:hypothetical protein
LICVDAGEEWARKVYALWGLRGVERQVGLTRGSSAARMVERKARRIRRSELVQGSGSQPKSARGVCGGSPQNRSGYLVEPQNQDQRLGRRRRDPSAPRSFDAGGDMAGSHGLHQEDAVTAWPCDEVECFMNYLPLRGLYHNLSARGTMVICLAQEGLIYICSRVSRQTIHPYCFSFPCSIGLDFSFVCKESDL